MPHIVTKAFQPVPLPKEREGIIYLFSAKNAVLPGEWLIAVQAKGQSFFLVVRENDDKVLLKSDKTTRPPETALLHKALMGYAKLANLEILHSNIPPKIGNPHLEKIDALKDIHFFAKHFPTDKEVHIEVGFGSGRHLLYQAKNNPDILFIGLEIHRPSIEQVLKQINIQNLQNLLVLDYDARLFLEQVPSNIVGKIYVHFPVPWDKKPHRRIISKAFIEESMRVLKKGGKLELRTDSENYYAYSYETFMDFPKIDIEIKKNKDIAITSKYEERWKRMEKNIYDIIMINDVHSDALRIEGSFSFDNLRVNPKTLPSLHHKKMVQEGYFVHFERLYTILEREDAFLVKLSLGSFDRPEHLYLIIEKEHISYYPREPLKSKANLLAHQKVCEVLRG